MLEIAVMRLYRTERESIDPRAALADLAARARSVTALTVEGARDLLVEIGALESALVDAWHPELDAPSGDVATARAASHAAGRLFVDALEGDTARARFFARRAAALLDELAARAELPSRVESRPPEGYTHYGLFPEQHLEAARLVGRTLRPARVVVVGLRSIGTSLAAVVAAHLESIGARVRSVTLRPRGAPFEREVRLHPSLAGQLAEDETALYLVVDEGPGLSGSSLAGAARGLRHLGVPEERLRLLPSHAPDLSRLRSLEARRAFERLGVVVADFDPAWAELAGARDLSAGRWRGLFCDERAAALANPRRERRKLLRDGAIHRFVGLARWGAARRRVAVELAAAGLTPPVLKEAHGFVAQPLVEGVPLRPDRVDGELVDRVADYVAFRRRAFVRGPTVDRTELVDATVENLTELAGDQAAAEASRAAQAFLAAPSEPAVHVDGRMQPIEWLLEETSAGRRLWKLDAIDHGDDHLAPGPTDAAWDLAGAVVELELAEPLAARLVRRYAALTGDAHLARRLPFLELAYLAHRLAEATLATGELEGDDARGFAALADRLRRRVAAAERAA
jgi:hypothetical protein